MYFVIHRGVDNFLVFCVKINCIILSFMINILFKIFVAIFCLTLIFFLWNHIAFAQFSLSPSLDNFVELQVFPNFPKANENIFFEVASYSTDLNQATIVWLKDGKQVASGVGLKNFSAKTGQLGTKIKMDVLIQTSNNKEVFKTVTIIPAEVDLIWEANSYTPPFYKGKALFPNEGKITVVAFPHILNDGGQRISDDKIIYKYLCLNFTWWRRR